MKDRVFKGWIPCLAGKLSFSVAGRFGGRGTQRCYTRTNNDISLFILENRNLRDGIFLRNGSLVSRFGQLINSDTNDLHFVLFATGKSGKSGFFRKVVGTIYIILGRPETYEIGPSGFMPNSIFSINFQVKRCGRVTLKNSKISDLADWDDNSTELEVEEYLASQTYVFLRDIMHRHKHHDGSSDTIIDIYPANGPRWERRVAYDLTRYIVKYTNSNSPDSYENALGTLAYLRSFISSVRKTGNLSLPKADNLESLEKSLNAEKIRQDRIVRERFWMCSSALAFTFSVGGIFVSSQDELKLEYLLAYAALLAVLFFSALFWTRILSVWRVPGMVHLRELTINSNIIIPFLLFSVAFIAGLRPILSLIG